MDAYTINKAIIESASIITQQQLKSLAFDITIEATIIDDSKAEQGRYMVSNGNAKFEAISSETGYKNKEVVLVTIPQGDYSKQKMIIGKQAEENESPLVYKSPFTDMANVSTNLISKNSSKQEKSIKANEGDCSGWNKDIPYFYQSTTYLDKEHSTSLIWDSLTEIEDENVGLYRTGFSRLGLRAQFSSWLNEYETVQGNYGLALQITFLNKDSNEFSNAFFTFDSNEFIGNVYNFDTYYTQETVFDISNFEKQSIARLQLFFYQRNNFMNFDGNKIYNIDDPNFDNILPNLFVKNPEIYLGVSTESFEQDSVQVVFEEGNTYDSEYTTDENSLGVDVESSRLKHNEKILQLQWIHKDDSTGGISAVKEDAIPPGYHIYWYRYSPGAQAPDAFCEAHWERFYGSNHVLIEKQDGRFERSSTDPQEEYNIKYTLSNYQIEIAKIKATFTEGTPEYEAALNAIYKKYLEIDVTTLAPEAVQGTIAEKVSLLQPDMATDKLNNIYFYPNITRQFEQIKVIIVKDVQEGLSGNDTYASQALVAASEIIRFNNNTEVVSEVITVADKALSIGYNDNSDGNYFIYNPDGRAKTDDTATLHLLNANFSLENTEDNSLLLLTFPYEYIKWSFPITNTMIIPATSPIESKAQQITDISEINEDLSSVKESEKNGIYYDKVNKAINIYYNRVNGNHDETEWVQAGYYINDNLKYTGNNTVRLEIKRNGKKYYAATTMNFGTAGTSGSDYTITIKWLNGNAFDVQKNNRKENALKGQVLLKDFNNQVVSLAEVAGDAKYEYSWCKVSNNTLKDPKDAAKLSVNRNNKYYPIETNLVKRLSHLDWLNEKTAVTQTASGVYSEYQYLQNNNDSNNCDYDNVHINFNYLLPFNKDSGGENLPTFYIYDITTHSFKPAENPSNKNQILYRHLTNYEMTNHPKPFYSFKKVNLDNATWTVKQAQNERYFILDNNTYIIDPYNAFIETLEYYEPILDPTKNYDGLSFSCQLDITENDLNEQHIKNDEFLIYNSDYNNNSVININGDNDFLYIFQIKLTNFGEYNLVAQFPLALKNSGSSYDINNYQPNYLVDYIEGPTSIRYSTNGKIDYEKAPYKIHFQVVKQNGDYLEKLQGFDKNSIIGHWELIYDQGDNIIQSDTSLLPSIIESDEIKDLKDADEESEDATIDNSNNLADKEILITKLMTQLKWDSNPNKNEGESNAARKKRKNYYYAFGMVLKHLSSVFNVESNKIGKCNQYNNSKAYNQDDLVKYNGLIYKALCSFSGGIPPIGHAESSECWQQIYYTDLINGLILAIRHHKNGSVFAADVFKYEQPGIQLYTDYLAGDADAENQVNIFEALLEKASLKKLKTLWLDLYKSKYIRVKEESVKDPYIKPVLNPPGTYYSNMPLFGVKFVIDRYITINETFVNKDKIRQPNPDLIRVLEPGDVLWIQPILVYQDNYPCSTLNKWSGKSIFTDDETNTITAHGFAAGKKEVSDNTFTGVILGDWGDTKSDPNITEHTGIYGFNHGAMSYALTDDGKAFFGQEGKGRIYFDGTSAQIYSAKWLETTFDSNTGLFVAKKEGMLLDVDDGQLLINGPLEEKTSISITEEGIAFAGNNTFYNKKTNLFKLGLKKKEYYLQSADYHEPKVVTVGKKKYARSGKGFRIDLANGKLNIFDLTLQIGEKRKTTNNISQHLLYYLVIDTSKSDLFKINNGAFKVTKSGNVVCPQLTVNKKLIIKSAVKGGKKWDKHKIKNNIKLTSAGDLTVKNNLTAWGNLLIKSTVKGGTGWSKNKIKNNIRITKSGQLTTKGSILTWGNLYVYFPEKKDKNTNKVIFKKGLHKIKLVKMNGHMVLVADPALQ